MFVAMGLKLALSFSARRYQKLMKGMPDSFKASSTDLTWSRIVKGTLAIHNGIPAFEAPGVEARPLEEHTPLTLIGQVVLDASIDPQSIEKASRAKDLRFDFHFDVQLSLVEGQIFYGNLTIERAEVKKRAWSYGDCAYVGREQQGGARAFERPYARFRNSFTKRIQGRGRPDWRQRCVSLRPPDCQRPSGTASARFCGRLLRSGNYPDRRQICYRRQRCDQLDTLRL